MRKGSGKSAPSLDGLRARLTGAPPYEGALLELLRDDPRRGAQALYRRCLRRQSDAAAEQDRLERLMQFERELRAAGFQRVAGVDEAGRGPLAGPIVAAAVILRGPVEGLNDSKQLSPVQRARAAALLRGSGHAVGTAVVGVDFIDRHGIQTANYAAMARAVAQLDPAPDFLLVDGFEIRGCGLPQKPLVKGDARSASIAAARRFSLSPASRLSSAASHKSSVRPLIARINWSYDPKTL